MVAATTLDPYQNEGRTPSVAQIPLLETETSALQPAPSTTQFTTGERVVTAPRLTPESLVSAGNPLEAPQTLATRAPVGGSAVDAASDDAASRIVELPPRPQPESRFQLLQLFECTVIAVTEGAFTAVLRDQTASARAESDEEATFDLSDVADGDVRLVVPGAVFYWYIGYRIAAWGQKSRVSELRFRRLPAWSRSDLAAIEREAAAWGDVFDVTR